MIAGGGQEQASAVLAGCKARRFRANRAAFGKERPQDILKSSVSPHHRTPTVARPRPRPRPHPAASPRADAIAIRSAALARPLPSLRAAHVGCPSRACV